MRKVALCLTTLLLVFISLFTMVSCGEDPFFHDVTILDPDGKEVELFSGVTFHDDVVKLPTLKDIDPDGTKRPDGKILAYKMNGEELDINTESVKVSKTVTIEAYWADGFYITYDSNNDKGETKIYPVKAGEEVKLEDGSLFTMDGMKIGSWNTAKDATGTRYDLSSSYTGTKDMTLYAKWRQIDDVVVSYDANNATEGTAPAQSDGFDPEETNITIAGQGNLKRTGMTFTGWNTKADGSGTTYLPGSVYKGSVSLTLYAQWARGFTITYHYKNASGKDATYVEVTELGKAPTYASLPSDAATGYVLDAWYEEREPLEGAAYHIAGKPADAPLEANIDLYGVLIDENVAFDEVTGGYSAKISDKGKSKTEDFTAVIPSIYHGKKVVAVSANAFYTGSNNIGYPVAVVAIPDTVTTIGENAFRGTKLTTVTIPENVESIGESAFHMCEQLSVVTFEGEKLTSIPQFAFASTAISAIDIPEKVTELANYAFGNCSSLEEVTLPGTLEKIGVRCFTDCVKLESIVIPKSIKSIGNEVFFDCTALKTVRVKAMKDKFSNYTEWGVDTSKITWGLYAVGETGPAGGIIIYSSADLKSSTYTRSEGTSSFTTDNYWYYLEAAPTDCEGDYQFGIWSKDGSTLATIVSSNNSEIGKGWSNTYALKDSLSDLGYSVYSDFNCSAKSTSYAYQAVENYKVMGTSGKKEYSDWFIPSESELKLMLELNDTYNLGLSGIYLSSTEAGTDGKQIKVGDTTKEGYIDTLGKAIKYNLRLVRQFRSDDEGSGS